MSINYPNYLIRVKYLKAITEGPGLRVPLTLHLKLFLENIGCLGDWPLLIPIYKMLSFVIMNLSARMEYDSLYYLTNILTYVVLKF